MYREVLKCVAEITDYPYSIEKWEAKETVKTSKEMIKQIGELEFEYLNGHKKLRQKFITQFIKDLKAEESGEQVEERKLSELECMTLMFVVIENELNIDKEESYLELYEDICESAGCKYALMRMDNKSDMTELILYYVLKTHQGFDIWAGLSKDWKERKETAYALNFEMDNLTTKNFKEVCERIKAGLDETGMETKNSLDIITENMNGIIADPTRLGKTKLEEVFNQEVILHVCDTGKRRQWYLYRLLSLVVIGQIEKFCRDIQIWQTDASMKEQLKKELKECWLTDIGLGKTNEMGRPLSKIAEYIDEYKEVSSEKWKEYLMSRRLNYTKVIHVFNELFDGGLVFNDYVIDGLEEDEIKEDLEKGEAFAPFEARAVRHGMDAEEKPYELRRMEVIFKEILTGEREVSREFLLLVVLGIKALGVANIQLPYINENLLFNCRFGTELLDTPFDEYFIEVFESMEEMCSLKERVNRLRMASWDFEDSCLEEGYAVFHDILFAKC
ncbi:hypothetical protein DXB47_14595 [Firmicutes bacterium OM04-13BH]|uniref:Uncharacterized protein n=1 Tax=Blautia stercoris TaxID=871664 RepID=A0ABR7PAR8_9FIRM|nr:hypothetical protein [Blautia stercoris]MBC8628492.1 hypothetical protein [Blautia stercoris]RGF19826.1 hypothetical protein DW128_08645 [Firmicutes bacterium AM10-47]RHV41568.1 hypothetical protein DXB47_14595 [Firmicutes bacterium OM04-13BH]